MKNFDKLQEEFKKSESNIKEIESASVELLKSIFDVTGRLKSIINEFLKPNLCPYCNENNTDSVDPNILCPDCRETFGHSFFNEL